MTAVLACQLGNIPYGSFEEAQREVDAELAKPLQGPSGQLRRGIVLMRARSTVVAQIAEYDAFLAARLSHSPAEIVQKTEESGRVVAFMNLVNTEIVRYRDLVCGSSSSS